MSSTFDAMAERTLSASFRTFGVAATYTDRDNAAVSCTVLLERDLTRNGEVAAVNQRTGVLQVRVAEVPQPPRRSERFTLADTGEVLTVDSVQATTDYLHRVFVS